MQVQIGPVSSQSVLAWVTYARAVLVAVTEGVDEPAVSPEVVDAFERYLSAWADHAAGDEQFVWTADLDAEEVEFLAYTWFTLAGNLAAGGGRVAAKVRARVPPRPDASEEFYQSLVTTMLDALAQEGRSLREFAEQLRDDWPGLQER